MKRSHVMLLLLTFVCSLGTPTIWALQDGERIAIPVQKEEGDSIFENAVQALQKNYVDKEFRENQLPAIVDRYRKRASEASTRDEQR